MNSINLVEFIGGSMLSQPTASAHQLSENRSFHNFDSIPPGCGDAVQNVRKTRLPVQPIETGWPSRNSPRAVAVAIIGSGRIMKPETKTAVWYRDAAL